MDSLKNHTLGTLQGVYDSIKGIVLVFYIDHQISKIAQAQALRPKIRKHGLSTPEKSFLDTTPKETADPKIMNRIFKNCALNGGFTWLSVYVFEYVLHGLKNMLLIVYGETSEDLPLVWSWLQWLLSFVFNTMWLVPIFLLSRIVSSLWFSDIADLAFRYRRGRPQPLQNISRIIADNLFSIIVETLFLFQAMLMLLFPNYLGMILHWIHLSLLHSLYAFEYKWYNMGWELHKRLSFIECNWAYFLGFGLPLTIMISLPQTFIVRCCVFSLVFPIFILSANEAQPIVGTCDFSLKLFSPVIAVSNTVFRGSKKVQQPPQTPSARAPLTSRRNLFKER